MSSAKELVDRIRFYQCDKEDEVNFNLSIKHFEDAVNENQKDKEVADYKKAREDLKKSMDFAEQSFTNAFMKRAIDKKNECDKLIEKYKIADKYHESNNLLNKALTDYDEGDKRFNEKKYYGSYNAYSESAESLKKLIQVVDKKREEAVLRIDFIKQLIDKAVELGGREFAKEELEKAESSLEEGIITFTANDFDNAEKQFDMAENFANDAIKRSLAKINEKKRQDALKAIMEAAKILEGASDTIIIDEKGEKYKGKKFEFKMDSEPELKYSQDSGMSYRDVFNKAVDYLKKARESYLEGDYDMAIEYSNIAVRLAKAYKSSGVKTVYKVRLIPDRRDCLWRIASYNDIYGDPFLWPVIWRTNKKEIFNPDLIFPGQVLAIPEID